MILFKAHSRGSTSVAFSPDGEYLATACVGEWVRLWTFADKPEKVVELPGSWGTHLAFSPDSRLLARGGLTRIWEVAPTEKLVFSFQQTSESLSFSPDGSEFALHVPEQGLKRWNTSTWQALSGGWGGTRNSTGGDTFPTKGLAYHPNGTLLATGFAVRGSNAYNSCIHIWEIRTEKLQHSLHSTFAFDHVTLLRFSPDGRFLAAIYGPVLRIWDMATQRECAVHRLGAKHFKGLAFTPDGKQLVTVSNDETVRRWAAPDWSPAGGFEWKIGKLTSLDVSPDGCRMAASSATGKVIIWDVD